jgi:thiamine-phosphate pyrophosphorylase
MRPLSDCKLYAFVDTAYLRGRPPEVIALNLCEGGADVVQLRAKSSSLAEIETMAERILPVTTRAGVRFVLNDHPALAAKIGAPFCHLGQEDFFDAGHKHTSDFCAAGSRLQIGLSTHSPDQARRALAADPAYIAIGPVFATGTKPTAKPVTLDYVRWASANVSIPWFAIGGITLQNLEAVVNAGARRICVVSAILNQDDVRAACRTFAQALK